jgi:hypothetical protein
MIKNRPTEREENLKERTAGTNNEQAGLQEAPHLQRLKTKSFYKLQKLKSQKEFFFVKQPSSSLLKNL